MYEEKIEKKIIIKKGIIKMGMKIKIMIIKIKKMFEGRNEIKIKIKIMNRK